MENILYCIPYTSFCFAIAEWKDILSIIVTLATIAGVFFTAYKAYHEVKNGRVQREREQQLKRTEFTLAQNRRLFDDRVLSSVLCLIDCDDIKLKEPLMWDAKRKFIVFFEEIELLVNSGDINKNVAYYMFGYYAKSALDGVNFKTGINLEKRYWGLFFKFVDDANKYLDEDFDYTKLSV